MNDNKQLQKIIGYKFKNGELLKRALTHGSYNYKNENNFGNYQRLEFLGDALLDFIVSEELFKHHPNYDEGMLTKVRANIVSKTPLANAIDQQGLAEFILCERNNPLSDKMKSDIFESITAAIYLDSGSIESARTFIMKLLSQEVYNKRIGDLEDYKSKIYEYCASNRTEIDFALENMEGDAHNLMFTYTLLIDGVEFARAVGSTKRKAQQECSRIALEKLNIEN